VPLIDLNLGRLGNPIADGLNQIQAARERQKQMDMERAKLLMQQQNQDADNQRANDFLKLQQDQFARTGKNEDEARQRQGAEDFQKIYAAAGHDPQMARQLGKAYGYEIVDGPNGPVAVQTSQAAKAAPPKLDDGLMTPQGMGSDNGIPQAGDVPAPAAPVPGVPQITPGAGAPQMGAPGAPATTDSFPGAAGPAGPTQPPPFMQGGAPPSATPVAAPPPPQPTEAQVTAKADQLNPILAAFRMRKGGQEFTVDPNAAKSEQEAAFAEQLKLKQAAPEARMAAAAIEAEKARQFKEAEDAKFKNEGLTFDQRKQLAEVSANGRVRAAGVSAMSPLRADSGNRQDMGSLRQEFKAWIGRNTANVDSQTNRRLQTAMSNLNSNNAMQQREAAESLVSIFKGGGQVTKASQDLLLSHLSGIVGDAQTWLQHLQNGQYGSREMEVLKRAAQGAIEEQNARMGKLYESAQADFGPGSGWENLGGNVNHMVKSEFKQFGLDVPDVYQQDTAPKVTLGSGSRPKKPNPIVKAKKTQGLAGQDKAAVDWANAHPNDERSAAILKANGL
jgi:hypothetical protein